MRRQFFTLLLGSFLHVFVAALVTLAPGAAQAGTAEDEALWNRLKGGGHVVLIRHAATEPGVGDPAGFDVNDCRTQRNLSSSGRSHAERIGAAFRTRGVPVGQVLSSHWCRCLDTARLAFGRVTPDRMLDSMFNDRTRGGDEKLAEVKRALQRPIRDGNLILVTHNFNISAIAGVSTAQGEMVIAEAGPDGRLRVIGTLSVP